MNSPNLILIILVLLSILVFLIFMLILEDWYAPRISAMGPLPSKAEEHAQKRLDYTAEYKVKSLGIVHVKNYRWSDERKYLVKMNKPTYTPMVHYMKYRKDKEHPDWYPYEEKLGEDGVWDYIGSAAHRIGE